MAGNELKPVKCGCGGASNIVKRLSRDYPVPVWYVECIKCNIETDDYFSEAEAIEAWNKAMGERTAKVEWYPHLTKLADGHCECGEDVRDDWKYCPNCGCKLEWK